MAAETQFSSNMGIGAISTANTNLDGTGTMTSILTASSNGTLIRTITIKALGDTTNGMVRFFIYNGTNKRLISEVEIPPVIKSATDPTFGITIPVNFALKAGWVLYASTEKAETFNIIAEGLNWGYYTSSVRYESTKLYALSYGNTISTANSNLNGTGTIYNVLGGGSLSSGIMIQSLNIKALVNTTPGMVRLFIYNGSTTLLFMEIPVPAITKSATAHSFSQLVKLGLGDFALPGSSYSIYATTEKGESFSVTAQSLNWGYPA